MKHFYIIIALVFSITLTQAQFTIATHDGTPITDGSTFTYSGLGYYDSELEEYINTLDFNITNIGTEILDMRLEYVDNTNADDTGEILCVFQSCLPPGYPTPGHIFPEVPEDFPARLINPGETTPDGDHFYNTDPGDGVNYPLEYMFKFFDIDGYGSPITFTYSYDGTASVEDMDQVSYKLHPTLASDFITLEVTEPVTAKLINIKGQIIKQFDFESGSHTIEVSSLSKQLYYLTLINNRGQRSIAKILVN